MTGDSRDVRIDRYYQDESAADLAEWLVDAEDEIEMWKGVVRTLEAANEELRYPLRMVTLDAPPAG